MVSQLPAYRGQAPDRGSKARSKQAVSSSAKNKRDSVHLVFVVNSYIVLDSCHILFTALPRYVLVSPTFVCRMHPFACEILRKPTQV
jgi:hypothetical protein